MTTPATAPPRGLAALPLGLAPLVLAGLLLAGCSGGEEDQEATPQEVLAQAKTTLDDTPGVRLTLTTDRLPQGVDGVLEAKGVGTHAPAFEGDIKVVVNSLTVDVPVVAVDGAVYATLPFTTEFVEIDPGDYGAPDPADLMAPEAGLSGWLVAAEDVAKGEQVRQGSTVLTEYTGTLPGDVVAGVIPSADEAATFDASFQVADDGTLSTIEVSGPFYGDKGTVDYAVAIDGYGTEQDIAAP